VSTPAATTITTVATNISNLALCSTGISSSSAAAAAAQSSAHCLLVHRCTGSLCPCKPEYYHQAMLKATTCQCCSKLSFGPVLALHQVSLSAAPPTCLLA
jgi:hypothetical protein